MCIVLLTFTKHNRIMKQNGFSDLNLDKQKAGTAAVIERTAVPAKLLTVFRCFSFFLPLDLGFFLFFFVQHH